MRCAFIKTFFVTILFVMAPPPSYARCPVVTPKISFTFDMVPVKYDYTLDKAQIRAKSNSIRNVSGHVQGKMSVNFKPDAKYSSNRSCIIVSKINVVIKNEPVLRVASNYKKGSCEYNVVKAHEEKHLALMNQFFKEVPRRYTSYLRDELKGRGATPRGAKDKYHADLSKILGAFKDKLLKDQKRLHNIEIDHPDKIAAEQAQCNNW